MAKNYLDLKILSKRLEVLEMQFEELKTIEPKVINERMSKVEQKVFSVKEMLTSTEAAEFLGISQSQIYKLTMTMQIPHFKPKGKTIYFSRKELINWMRKNHVVPVKQKDEKQNTKDEKQEEK